MAQQGPLKGQFDNLPVTVACCLWTVHTSLNDLTCTDSVTAQEARQLAFGYLPFAEGRYGQVLVALWVLRLSLGLRSLMLKLPPQSLRLEPFLAQ